MKTTLNKLAFIYSAGIICALAMSTDAQSAEAFYFARPIGVFDIFAAELPPVPGFYALGVQNYSSYDAITNGSGDPTFPDSDGTRRMTGLGGLFVYPEEIFGGRMASSIAFGYGRHDLTVTNMIPGLSGDNRGLFDATGDLFFWQKSFYDFSQMNMTPGVYNGPPPGFSIGAGVAFNVPIGAFETGRIGNTGLNSWVIAPNVAVTFRTQPWLLDGTEFSARLFYNHVFERVENDYSDGDYVNLDWALTERYDRFQFGLTGTIASQIEDDKGPGAALDGQRSSAVMFGALLSIDVPEWKSRVTLKYLDTVKSDYFVDQKTISIAWAVKL